mmetsp:Transcript_10220/g.30172  ORF Transcript_10220/g.30172 Transcript_10220/m.30172 type:complete len:306 (+) Transcript_10220:301-1218(+)
MPANGDSESMAIVVFDGVNIQTLCQAPLCLSREPRCNLAEGLAVCEGHPLLELRWLARAVWASEGASPVGRGTVRLVVGEYLRIAVAKGDEGHAMVGHLRNEGEADGFLAAVLGSGGHKHAPRLAHERAALPVAAGPIPELLELRREHAIATRETKHEGIILCQHGHGDHRVVSLGRRPHLSEYLCAERLRELEHVHLRTARLESFLDGVDHCADVPVGGVVDDGHLRAGARPCSWARRDRYCLRLVRSRGSRGRRSGGGLSARGRSRLHCRLALGRGVGRVGGISGGPAADAAHGEKTRVRGKC